MAGRELFGVETLTLANNRIKMKMKHFVWRDSKVLLFPKLSMINEIMLVSSPFFSFRLFLLPCFTRIPKPLIITIYGVRFSVGVVVVASLQNIQLQSSPFRSALYICIHRIQMFAFICPVFVVAVVVCSFPFFFVHFKFMLDCWHVGVRLVHVYYWFYYLNSTIYMFD